VPAIEAVAVFLVLVAVFLLAWVAYQIGVGSRRWESGLDRLDARLDEQSKRGDAVGSDQRKSALELQEKFLGSFGELRGSFEKRQGETQKGLQDSLQGGVDRIQKQLADHLARNTEDLVKRMESLTKSTDERLGQISGQVEKRLTEGFDKTNQTFVDIQKRLALIDDAQKKITELSTNVVSLQRVLADRTSRGAFGEIQLEALVRNVLPEAAYKMQHTLSNSRRVDCMLFLPEPTGLVPIDSKFPLENYRKTVDPDATDEARKTAEKDFARDVQMHIYAVASKYIIPGETSDGAILFIPAEAVFAEIHSKHYALVEQAQRAHVWMASPTTLMAILTTAASVIKDSETRERVHEIQEHLRLLSKDFERFEGRMGALARHIEQAHEDVGKVNISARKISNRFQKIEKLEVQDDLQGEFPLLVEEPEGAADSAGV